MTSTCQRTLPNCWHPDWRKKLLSDSARINFFCNRHQEYLRFFSTVKDLVYCADIAQLLLKLEVSKYGAKDWKLFIDSSKQSMKCVLLHNGNQFASVPIAHSTSLKENYEAVKLCWGKLIMISISGLFVLTWRCWILLGELSDFAEYPYFLCMWDSITRRRTGLCRRNWCLAKKGTLSTTLWWTERKYSSHRCTSTSA